MMAWHVGDGADVGTQSSREQPEILQDGGFTTVGVGIAGWLK